MLGAPHHAAPHPTHPAACPADRSNSLDAQATISTDKLTVCKAGQTLVVNKTYVTIKHLGSGTFGRVMLCFNVFDQRLYAIKACRKSQFAQSVSRYNHSSRLRRNSQLLHSSSGATGGSFTAPAAPHTGSLSAGVASAGGQGFGRSPSGAAAPGAGPFSTQSSGGGGTLGTQAGLTRPSMQQQQQPALASGPAFGFGMHSSNGAGGGGAFAAPRPPSFGELAQPGPAGLPPMGNGLHSAGGMGLGSSGMPSASAMPSSGGAGYQVGWEGAGPPACPGEGGRLPEGQAAAQLGGGVVSPPTRTHTTTHQPGLGMLACLPRTALAATRCVCPCCGLRQPPAPLV